ncbi:GCN5-related N-acetyltransferase (GNAT) domain-containingprotein [Purpureocillium lilacinum]|uniref:Acyl-CoA N-acyltransferase n=2 Tax=Purpureocillium lilacinum TaxID=33203 RepID=A0A179HAB0_PURLI|nr:GCN5-related N-acetyltransferase (GNAT) domain-containingprotein [Purpureocillium lilacinum]KAK4078450.1 hypothetical protein Purlil1_11968 [Purpureocillium lilacinum]OAQ86852.1 GCN5-related N-acetyltransferase (GNAT) domain-containingprotein [Purpureocillium lilacinum]OAQ94819.1 GCN5-related N-acetyltransferase (GNAT) domain-containingprotein [Purpureocillium lilacinum]PWI70346.1 Acyl-CoA N-acyltransferase [Purpureocillium lilacinum]GJN66906.1 hypothetical protein PLICBS_000928 [Purpureoci
MAQPGTVLPFDPKAHAHLTPYLAAIHASCITHDRAIATFLPPLSHEKLLSWWKERIAEVNDGKRRIWILVGESSHDAPTLTATAPTGRPKGPEVMGVVMLAMPYSETGPFRGAVEKLLIHKSWRGKGGATALMAALEADAAKLGRTTLMLDTETGSPAEALFKKLGYTELGKIPKYGLSPTGELKDGTFFYKQL